MDQDIDDTFDRIVRQVGTKPEAKGREVTWLADRLHMTVQRVNNWKRRGVPASALVDIAAALGWTVNQVLGLSEPPDQWPFETIPHERFARLTPRQAAMVELVTLAEIERIEAQSKREGTGG